MFRLAPLGRRRFDRFKKNRRGWWSLWLFIGLFVVTLGGELIANDKPLVVSYQNQLYFPVFKRYTAQEFGGQLPFQADYRSDNEIGKEACRERVCQYMQISVVAVKLKKKKTIHK